MFGFPDQLSITKTLPPAAPSIPERRTWREHTSQVREITLKSPHMCSAYKQDKYGTQPGKLQ